MHVSSVRRRLTYLTHGKFSSPSNQSIHQPGQFYYPRGHELFLFLLCSLQNSRVKIKRIKLGKRPRTIFHTFPLLLLQDCAQVPTDGKRSTNLLDKSYGVYDGTLNRLNEPVNYEIKDGQWLGVEVKSQGEGGKVIVCAHRSVEMSCLWRT